MSDKSYTRIAPSIANAISCGVQSKYNKILRKYYMGSSFLPPFWMFTFQHPFLNCNFLFFHFYLKRKYTAKPTQALLTIIIKTHKL